MIGRIRPPIPERQLRADLRAICEWCWLSAGTALCALAIAAPPAPPAPGESRAATPGQHESPSQGVPDDEFIEFLGADDVGDETWWEFLRKAPLRGGNPPATPPREAKE
jgi:hypothetical protein